MPGCLERSEQGDKVLRVEAGEVAAIFILGQNVRFYLIEMWRLFGGLQAGEDTFRREELGP